jgi:hypothetical protein
MMPMSESGQAQLYSESVVDAWLENDFFNTLDPATQTAIPQVNVQFSGPGGSVREDARKIFVLSSREYNMIDPSGFPTVGSPVEYFGVDGRSVSNYEGTPCKHHTRTMSNNSLDVAIITPEGTVEVAPQTTVAGVRPAFTLPPTFEVTAGMPKTANTQVAAEVI